MFSPRKQQTSPRGSFYFSNKAPYKNIVLLIFFKRVRVMVFNATFNNISVISWRSVLLVKETEVPRENTDLTQVTDKLYSIIFFKNRNDHNIPLWRMIVASELFV